MKADGDYPLQYVFDEIKLLGMERRFVNHHNHDKIDMIVSMKLVLEKNECSHEPGH